jgi:hypothetical protein
MVHGAGVKGMCACAGDKQGSHFKCDGSREALLHTREAGNVPTSNFRVALKTTRYLGCLTNTTILGWYPTSFEMVGFAQLLKSCALSFRERSGFDHQRKAWYADPVSL